MYFVLSEVPLKMDRDNCDRDVPDGFISESNQKQWEVTVMCFISPE
jgi:hypothetical protein